MFVEVETKAKQAVYFKVLTCKEEAPLLQNIDTGTLQDWTR